MFRIEEILKERELTKKAFGDLIGTSKQNVNALLKNPTLNKLETIANALGVPTWQLFVDPEDIYNDCSPRYPFCAFVRTDTGETYSANSLQELRALVDTLENKKKE